MFGYHDFPNLSTNLEYDLINRFDGKHILITGGTGFFGVWLLSFFSKINKFEKKVYLTVLSRHPDFFIEEYKEYKNCDWITWVQGDINSFYLTASRSIDYIIHAAADTSLQASPIKLINSITIGVQRVLELAVQNKVKRVLLAGSGAQYGVIPFGSPVKEVFTGACKSNSAASAYGEAKRYQETLAAIYAEEYGIDVIMTRCFTFSGAGLPLDGNFAIGNFVRDALFSNEIVIQSSGDSVRSYMHGSDLAIWLLTLLLKGQRGEAYNVGSDKIVSIKSLAEIIISRLAPGKKIRILDQRKNFESSYYVPDITKACSLELKVWTSLDESIDNMAAWAKNNKFFSSCLKPR